MAIARGGTYRSIGLYVYPTVFFLLFPSRFGDVFRYVRRKGHARSNFYFQHQGIVFQYPIFSCQVVHRVVVSTSGPLLMVGIFPSGPWGFSGPTPNSGGGHGGQPPIGVGQVHDGVFRGYSLL